MSQTTSASHITRHTVKKMVNVPLNRVEGDLEINVELYDNIVADAWSSGTMYRGIENILHGRAALDGLVITPRICGICSTAHLTAAANALDAITGATPSSAAIKIRNLAMMSELIQSDVRQMILSFMPDFASASYQNETTFEEASRRYAPFKGESAIEVIQHTKRIVEIIAILGGQWPHSAYMVPGGVVTLPSASELLQCRHILSSFRSWYEKRILGCSIERWHAVDGNDAIDDWINEDDKHRDSDLGCFIRFARQFGLDRIGQGHDNFLSVGGLPVPQDSAVADDEEGHLFPAGFATAEEIQPFDQREITEHVAHSWYVDYTGGRHPFEGETKPYATGNDGRKYSWAKAPRYADKPAETGPLAQMIMRQTPLFLDLIQSNGASAFARQLARVVRPALLLPIMDQWLSEISPEETFYNAPPQTPNGKGFGLTEASRGSLGHWISVKDDVIEHYQIITPTAWNGSPRDADHVRGPWEQALIGTTVSNPENPVELGHIVRSFDPCLVCTVHAVHNKTRIGTTSFGGWR